MILGRQMDNATLREQYPALYSIVCHKGDTIAKVIETSPPVVAFRRDLFGQRLVACNALLQRLANIQLQMGMMNSVGTYMKTTNF
jgi:hypothetical protein